MIGIPILTYHSLHAPGQTYAENDHLALESDLVALHQHGFEFVRLSEIADHLIAGNRDWFETGRKVGISFDDGVNHDWIDFEHPAIPTLKSFRRILEEFNTTHRRARPATATSFVIASTEATRTLDQTCIAGRDQWHDGWWTDAAESGLIDIGNHSWDHLHGTLPSVAHSRNARDDFAQVDSLIDAEQQIAQAENRIRSVIGSKTTALLAYPDGKRSEFLIRDFLPNQSLIHAAFTTDGHPVTALSSRWEIPRYTCGDHWKTADDFKALIQTWVQAG